MLSVALLLLVAAAFVPATFAIFLDDLPHARRYALGLVGLAGLAASPLMLGARALAWSLAYAALAGGATATLVARVAPRRLVPVAGALLVSLALVTAALAWVATLA